MKRRILVLLMVCMLLPCMAAAEEQKAEISFRLSSDQTPIAEVRGALSGVRAAYAMVTMQLLGCGDPDETMEKTYEQAKERFLNIGEEENMTSVLAEYRTAITDENGNYFFSYPQKNRIGSICAENLRRI